jgi:hypothetical protein
VDITSVKTVELPNDPQEIIRRLATVNSDPVLVERFYPIIARDGVECKWLPEGIIHMLMSAIGDMENGGYSPLGIHLLFVNIPRFVDVLIDDGEAAEAVKQFLRDVDAWVEAGRPSSL